MQFFQPRAYIDYTLPKLTEGKVWYVSYQVLDPSTNKLKRIRIKVNRFGSPKEKRAAAKSIMARISEQLILGWNPLVEKVAPKAYAKMLETLDKFISVKSKELESTSMHCYNSYVNGLRDWLFKHKFDKNTYVCAFSKSVALEWMQDLESDVRISPRTYNNYLTFMRTLFNWMVERGYTSENPFVDIRKKSERRTIKNRRTLTEDELSRLWEFLSQNNKEYLAMCLLCYCCFLRPKEIALLRCRDIDLQKQAVYVSGNIAKNDNNSVRTIPDEILPYLQVLDLSHQDLYIFADHSNYQFTPGKIPFCSRRIAKYWDCYVRPACHFPMEVKFYSLKDTGVTNMIGEGVPITFVQQQADHSSLEMTAKYIGRDGGRARKELKGVNLLSI